VARAVIDLVERRARGVEVALPRGREGDAMPAALEQREIQPAFERGDVAADRALRHAQLLRRAREVAAAGRGFEGAQGVEGWKTARHWSGSATGTGFASGRPRRLMARRGHEICSWGACLNCDCPRAAAFIGSTP
jgi:hypothetical protein